MGHTDHNSARSARLDLSGVRPNVSDVTLLGRLRPYVRIARFDHWFKNVFLLPGVAFAFVLFPGTGLQAVLVHGAAALLAAGCIASANYVINEFLDAEFDRHHPTKHLRPAVSAQVAGRYVLLEYVAFALVGLAIAAWVNWLCMTACGLLLAMGVIYNVRPFRSKDHAFVDVVTESVNMPIRFVIGWSAVTAAAFPPSSILLSFWFGGAYLMSVKRLSEYRQIADPARAGLYRASFRRYSEERLLASSMFHGMSAAFFTAIFLFKYKVEFILSFPAIAALFTWYLIIGLRRDSAAQAPERLYQERAFVAFVGFLVALITMLFLVDIPELNMFLEPNVYPSRLGGL